MSDLDVIVNELSSVSGKWENIGRQLGMADHFLNDISEKHSGTADCLEAMMKKWLRRLHLNSWSHIVLALKNPNIMESMLGDHLKKKYLPGGLSDMIN